MRPAFALGRGVPTVQIGSFSDMLGTTRFRGSPPFIFLKERLLALRSSCLSLRPAFAPKPGKRARRGVRLSIGAAAARSPSKGASPAARRTSARGAPHKPALGPFRMPMRGHARWFSGGARRVGFDFSSQAVGRACGVLYRGRPWSLSTSRSVGAERCHMPSLGCAPLLLPPRAKLAASCGA